MTHLKNAKKILYNLNNTLVESNSMFIFLFFLRYAIIFHLFHIHIIMQLFLVDAILMTITQRFSAVIHYGCTTFSRHCDNPWYQFNLSRKHVTYTITLTYNAITLWKYRLWFSLKNVCASGCIICDTTCRTWH